MNRHIKALAVLKAGTVIPAIPLALHADRTFDELRQRRLVRYYMEAGAGGIAAAVHSTQFAIRDPKYHLYEPVLSAAAEEIDRYEAESGRILVRIAGVCGPAAQAVKEAETAKSYGYDAVLLSPGGLGALTEEELLARTRAVAEILPVVGFYLQDAVGGRKLSRGYWKQLADIPNVAAVKCACFDRYRTEDLVRGVLSSSRAEEVTLYTGNDDHIIMDFLTPFEKDGRKVFFEGGLLGQWSVWTAEAVRLFAACRACRESGTIPMALLSAAERLTEANGAIFDVDNRFAGCIPGIHYVLQKQGLLEGTWCLDPDEVLSPGQAEKIDRVIQAYPELTDDVFVKEFLNR